MHAGLQTGTGDIKALPLERAGGVDDQMRTRRFQRGSEIRIGGIQPAQFDGLQIHAWQMRRRMCGIATGRDDGDAGSERQRTHDARTKMTVTAQYENSTAFLLRHR
ncbi:hypothetical protein D3C81_1416550 [compost metagenome]